jgi:hypothetical protein
VRFAWLLVALVACSGKPVPAPDCPCGGDCLRACRPGEEDCTLFPYEALPARCQDICHLGECCEIMNGTATVRFVECARPADAGVDTLRDGGLDV